MGEARNKEVTCLSSHRTTSSASTSHNPLHHTIEGKPFTPQPSAGGCETPHDGGANIMNKYTTQRVGCEKFPHGGECHKYPS
eukprot:6236173-Pyramimonas_sp.AAC.1